MIKRIIGALYGIFLEEPLDRLHNWQKRFEKEYLNYCRTGCKNCYKWNGYCRSQASGTPYKKFRRKGGRKVGNVKAFEHIAPVNETLGDLAASKIRQKVRG